VEAGMTFRLSYLDEHLWVILSDPEKYPDKVVCVNFTSGGDDTCLVKRSEHPLGLTHDSCIGYQFAKVIPLKNLYKLKDVGHLQLEPDRITQVLLERIRQSAGNAKLMDDEVADTLIEQGYIDLAT
jgi:hypothetical protein